MAIPGADRFLNCVLNRSNHDMVLKIIVLLLVVFATPSYMLYGMIVFQIKTGEPYPLSSYFTIVMLMAIIILFLVYMMIRSLTLHHERDLEWMESLTRYASHFRKDTSELKSIRRQTELLSEKRYQRIAFWVFVVVTVLNLSQCIYGSRVYIEPEILDITETAVIVLILVDLSVVTLVMHLRISQLNTLQCRFTEVFAGMMSDDDHPLEPMESDPWSHRLCFHAAAMIVTLGLYTVFFSFWVVHEMNMHIKRQWAYEKRVLDWMAAKDRIVGVTKVEWDGKRTVLHQLRRMI